MAKFIEIEIEDPEDILMRIDAIVERRRDRSRALLDNLSDFALHALRANVPVDRRYLIRHTDRSELRWRPGGAGGGGSWESVVGVKRGLSKHPLYVEFGTGLYGAVGWYITPQTHAFMTFYSRKYHRLMHVASTRGQRPQPYFYTTWRELTVYARGRLMAMDALL
jgi:hypothetical protein